MALFKNKETDKKRKGENVIGKIIYGFLLFAPLMSILFTSLYTVFNKNAYESYSGNTEQIINVNVQYKYDTNEVNDVNDLVDGNIYHYEYENVVVTDSSYNFNVYGIYNLARTSSSVVYNYNLDVTSNIFNVRIFRSNYCFGVTNSYGGGLLYVAYNEIPNNLLSFDFVYKSDFPVDLLNNVSISTFNIVDDVTYDTTEVSYLDNAFEYGMYKTEQSNIYNWSKTTGTYTVLQNVCNGIGITNTFVPMLMAYWLLISIIYFLFNIALILIWAVHDKIHALKDAI